MKNLFILFLTLIFISLRTEALPSEKILLSWLSTTKITVEKGHFFDTKEYINTKKVSNIQCTQENSSDIGTVTSTKTVLYSFKYKYKDKLYSFRALITYSWTTLTESFSGNAKLVSISVKNLDL